MTKVKCLEKSEIPNPKSAFAIEPPMSQATLVQPPPVEPGSPEDLKYSRRESRRYGLFAPHLVKAALKQSFVMLRPDIQWKNPVMFVVEVGTVLSIIFTFMAFMEGSTQLAYLI